MTNRFHYYGKAKLKRVEDKMEIYNISNYENLRKKSEKSSNINQAILKFENGNLNNKLNNYYEYCIKT